MKLSELSVEQILRKYEFSHRFYVIFACRIASIALSQDNSPDPRSVAGVKAAMDYINGKISKEEMKTVTDGASTASFTVASAAANAACYAAITAFNPNAAPDLPIGAAARIELDSSKKILMDMISELSPAERALLGVEI